jgi:hypothetical protein
MKAKPQQYCRYICLKIGFYLKKIHKFELIKLQAEFHSDEFGKLWLYKCQDIWVRTYKPMQIDHDKMLS